MSDLPDLPKIKSGFAILDVKHGRKTLSKLVAAHPGAIPVTIQGFIIERWSEDDGESIEFGVDVIRVSLRGEVR